MASFLLRWHLLLAAFALCAVGCDWASSTHGDGAPDADRRVMLVGVDGATWDIIDDLVADGQLPNFEALIAEGTRGRLLSLLPSKSPRIWTSIATGVPPEIHGIVDFTFTSEGKRHLFTSEMIRVPTLWEIASEKDVSVGVTGYWFTYPAQPVNGYVISDHTVPSRSARWKEALSVDDAAPLEQSRLVYPPELWDDIKPLLERDLPKMPFSGFSTLERRFKETYDALIEEELFVDMTVLADGAYHPRLSVVYLKAVDQASHFFWQYFEPEHPVYRYDPASTREVALYRDVIPWVYRHTDVLLGELRALLRPNDVLVVLSDHGFEAVRVRKGQGVSGSHGVSPKSIDGIYLMAGGPVSASREGPDLSLFDITPTILHLLGIGVPAYAEGKVAGSILGEQFMERHPVRIVEGSRNFSAGRAAVRTRVPEEAQRLERLKALGYIED